MASRWFRRKTSQPLGPSGSLGPRFIQREIVRSEDLKAEHEEFPMYPRRSPAGVLGNHPEDQIPNFLRNPSPPCRLSDPGDQPPVETKACPVPPDHCLWRHQDQSFLPGEPELMSNDPEQFVEQIEPWPRMSTFQNGELLPQREIL